MPAWQEAAPIAADRAVLGIEPRTSRTLSENHTTRPNSQLRAAMPSERARPTRLLPRPNFWRASLVCLVLPQLTVWPSGLRRWLQAPVRKGVGSNPTAVIAEHLAHVRHVQAKRPMSPWPKPHTLAVAANSAPTRARTVDLSVISRTL